ncbi:MAG: oligosaccharide flippase family protein [Bacteroidaceae bacterium]|nr:oligosaccharide flippase family protein [Bacteroidaceae bacterium]
MDNKTRILVNTLAQYTKTIINMVLSLYSTRLVLRVLGVEDYGIYNLVAGIIAMLSFIVSSLSVSTQRFISYNQGKNDVNHIKKIFVNSLFLHLAVAIIFSVVLFSITSFLFDGYLNIPSNRVDAALVTYIIVVVSLMLTFIGAPYRALVVSHENIVYSSIIQVLDGVIKVVLVIILQYVSFDKLITYAFFTLLIQIVNFLCFSIYCKMKYEECVLINIKYFNKDTLLSMIGFTGWQIYGVACLSFRQQGVAIVLNKFLGTAINAAYGLGFQVSSYLNFIATSLSSAIRPQLMKAEGGGNRNKMLLLSFEESKIALILTTSLLIPCCFEIEGMLKIWLTEVPAYSSLFCRMFMICTMLDMTTTGLYSAIYSTGKIRNYSLFLQTPKLLVLLFAYLSLQLGHGLKWLVVSYVLIEATCAFLRLLLAKHQLNFSLSLYFNKCISKLILPISSCCIVSYLITSFIPEFNSRFFITISISAFIQYIIIYVYSLDNIEKDVIQSMINKIKNKK